MQNPIIPDTNNDSNKAAIPAHHPYGPSKWPALLACNCFEARQGDTSDTTLGTRCHELFENVITGKVFDADDPEYRTWVAKAVETFLSICNDHKIDLSSIHTEERMAISDGLFGTADVVCRGVDGSVHIIDYKTFHNPGRDYTPQLAAYAYMLRKLTGLGQPIWGHIIYGEDGAYESSVMEKKNVEMYVDDVKHVRDLLEQGLAKPTQCNWCELCDKAAVCGAYSSVAKATMNAPAKDVPQNWGDLTPVQKAKAMVIAEAAEKWAALVKEKAKQDLINGLVIESEEDGAKWKLRKVSGRLTPRVRDTWELLKSHGIDRNTVMDVLKVSSTDVVRLLMDAGESRASAKSLADGVSDRTAGSVSMVRA